MLCSVAILLSLALHAAYSSSGSSINSNALPNVLMKQAPDGWTYLVLGEDGVVQNAVMCTAPLEERHERCDPDPAKIKVAYTQAFLSLIPALLDVSFGDQSHKSARGLFLGLGTGTMPRFLHHYFPQTEFDVVEINKEVVDRVQTYITLPPNMQIYNQDALQFISRQASKENSPLRYDFVVHDVFTTNGPVHALNNIDVYTGLLKLLEGGGTGEGENGVLIANVWCLDKEYYQSIAELYLQVFSSVRLLGPRPDIDMEGNCMVIAHTPKAHKVNVVCADGLCRKMKKSKSKVKSKICTPFADIITKATEIQTATNMELDAGEVLRGIYEKRPLPDDDRFC